MGVQTKTTINVFQKKSRRKSGVFTKQIDKNPKPIFWLVFNRVFGRFKVSGVQKRH
jgi:hypothetical protein